MDGPLRCLVAVALLWCAAGQGREDTCAAGGCDADESPLLQLRQAPTEVRTALTQGDAADEADSGRAQKPPILTEDIMQVTKALFAHSIIPDEDKACKPDMIKCFRDKDYRARCPGSCESFCQLAQAAADKDEKKVVKVLEGMVDTATKAMNLGPLEKLAPNLTDLPECPPCPSVSCCLKFPLTAIEAAVIKIGMHNISGQEPTTVMFDTLAVKSALGLAVGNMQSAEYYYDNTIAFYGEQANAYDLGWGNCILGNMVMYWEGGIHKYRKVPVGPRGRLDYHYSVSCLPEPARGTPLKIGLIADWGCGNLAARRVLEELASQEPDVVLHLGDVYYSGTKEEQEVYFYGLAKEILKDIPILSVPGNHDYYSDGQGFLDVIDKLAGEQQVKQEATYFALRNREWQIVGLDTGILDSFTLDSVAAVLPFGDDWKRFSQNTMPFVPDDQLDWALHQLKLGKERGLKTILLSHHQLFSRKEPLGYANGGMREAAFSLDTKAGVYETNQWSKKSKDLPGRLGPEESPTANTRLLDQFSRETLAGVTAWFWGHEHGMSLYEEYAGLAKGRLIGNACIPIPKMPLWDAYGVSEESVGKPWGGYPKIIEGTEVKQGDKFWAMGFALLELDGSKGKAKYFQLTDSTAPITGNSKWGKAEMFYEEDL